MSERDELFRHPPLTGEVDDLVAQLDALLARVRRLNEDGHDAEYRRRPPVALDPALVDDLYDRLADLRDALEEGP